MLMDILKQLGAKQAKEQAKDINPLDMLSLLPMGAGLKVGRGVGLGVKSLKNLWKSPAAKKINPYLEKILNVPKGKPGIPKWYNVPKGRPGIPKLDYKASMLGGLLGAGTGAALPWVLPFLNKMMNPKAHDAIDEIISEDEITTEETNPMEYFPPDSPELNPRTFENEVEQKF